MSSEDETPLTSYDAPSGVARSGDVVLRNAGPWTPAVVALLRHLEDVGFTGSPRVVGDGIAADGRMAVGYLEGDSPHPGPWPEDRVGEVGTLLRAVHDATASFVPPPDAVWHRTWLHDVADDGDLVVGHGDPAPWNVVGTDGGADAFVDWENAGPVPRLSELAYAVWLNAQLHDDDVAELQGLPDAAGRARQAHLLLDAYGVPSRGRAAVVDRMIELAVHAARAEAVTAGITPDSTEAVDATGYPVLWGITWRARSASWMLRHRSLLLRGAD